MKKYSSFILVMAFGLFLFSSPAKCGIHDTYLRLGYSNIPVSFIVQFPFVNGFIRQLQREISSHRLFYGLLEFVSGCYEGSQDINALIYLESELTITTFPHIQSVHRTEVWLFDPH